MRSGANWGLTWLIGDVGYYREFFEQVNLPKPQSGPWSRVWQPMRHGIDRFCAFHISNCPNYTVRKNKRSICAVRLTISGLPRVGVATGS